MNGLKAVTDLSLYLNENLPIKVFKFKKQDSYKGEYIAINHLPFVFDGVVSGENILNVNVHVKTLTNGDADTKKISKYVSAIQQLIPIDRSIEDNSYLYLDGSYYMISSISQPIEDKDDTHFVNIKVRVIFNNLK